MDRATQRIRLLSKKHLVTREVALLLDHNPRSISLAIRQKRLPATAVGEGMGKMWLVTVQDVREAVADGRLQVAVDGTQRYDLDEIVALLNERERAPVRAAA